jgi:hypothetical protein
MLLSSRWEGEVAANGAGRSESTRSSGQHIEATSTAERPRQPEMIPEAESGWMDLTSVGVYSTVSTTLHGSDITFQRCLDGVFG